MLATTFDKRSRLLLAFRTNDNRRRLHVLWRRGMITSADRFFLGHLSMRKQVSTFFEKDFNGLREVYCLGGNLWAPRKIV